MLVSTVSESATRVLVALSDDEPPLGGVVAVPEVGPSLWVWALVLIVAVTVALRVVRSIGKIIMVLAAFGLLGGGSLAFLTGLFG